jgi:hypothetical protein
LHLSPLLVLVRPSGPWMLAQKGLSLQLDLWLLSDQLC